jgi:hypothetical protein
MNLICCCAFAVMMLMSGCKPVYENRIVGSWKLDTYLYNSVDKTGDFLLAKDDYTLTFYEENNDFVEKYNALKVLPVTNTGTWVIERKPNGKINEYQLRLSDDNNVRVFDIKKLSKDEIDIYRDLDDGDSEEYLLEPVAE